MKILYVVSDQNLASEHGGTTHVLAVSRELARHGHEVHVAHQEGGRVDWLSAIVSHPLPKRHKFLLSWSGAQIQKLLESIQPDVVMERYYNFAGEGILRAHRMKMPTVLEVNSPMIEYPGSTKSRIDGLLGGKLRRRRDQIASDASLILAPIREIVPEAFREKVREIEWGADSELFDPTTLPDRDLLRIEKGFDPADTLLLHFGSLRKWHGLVKLLEAFDNARPHFRGSTKLVIVGPAEKIQRENVHFAGVVAHEEMPAWLKMCDLAVFPFSPEQHRYLELGFYWSPLKIFESMAMELPVLTLNIPRLMSILGVEGGNFYYDGTMMDLSGKMALLLKNPESLQRIGQSLRERLIRHYSWKVHGEKLNSWLLELQSARSQS